jgi:hypothetical protein
MSYQEFAYVVLLEAKGKNFIAKGQAMAGRGQEMAQKGAMFAATQGRDTMMKTGSAMIKAGKNTTTKKVIGRKNAKQMVRAGKYAYTTGAPRGRGYLGYGTILPDKTQRKIRRYTG